ncbi:MAG: hypothetical protein ACLR0J_00870, partial [Anaerostipes hadrus]
SYKLKANQYVTLKISYSSTNKIRVGIVSKSRKYVALKNIKSNDIQRIKVGETVHIGYLCKTTQIKK